MIEEICSHQIYYSWKDGKERSLGETDIEHITKCLMDNCNQGELCQYDHEEEAEVYGWWKIE